MMHHYFSAEADMKARYGNDIILVREPEKIEHYIQRLGAPIGAVWAYSQNAPNGAEYVVFRTHPKMTMFQLMVSIGVYKPLQ
jgi:hypothetical protein